MNVVTRADTSIKIKRLRHYYLWYTKLTDWFIANRLLYFMIGLLLGRAVILYNISPFAIAFLAAIWSSYEKKFHLLILFIWLGAWTFSAEHAVFIMLSTVIFLLMTMFLKDRSQIKWVIVFVFFSTVMTRVFLYSLPNVITLYEVIHLVVEGILGVVLYIIFMQVMPFLVQNSDQRKLKNEDLICFVILIGSMLTAFMGWQIYSLSIEHILSRFVVLVFAFIGGTTTGATVGVVAGLILSLANVMNLYQMSLLAFSGLLGGMLKEGKKHGATLGLIVGTILLGMYGGIDSLLTTILESIIAIALFYMIPSSLLKKLSSYIPGTSEYSFEERKYLQKVRDVTAKRVEQFSDVFATLSNSFIHSNVKIPNNNHVNETDHFLSVVTAKTCQQCFMKERCWQQQFDPTYELMVNMKNELLMANEIQPKTKREFENHCVKSKQVTRVMKQEISILEMNQRLKKQILESKKIVADQLKGVSDIMDNFAKEIVEERVQHEKQEMEIIKAIRQMDIQVENIDIYTLEKGNIDIEMSVMFYDYFGEDEKLIAPVLTEILDETIIVKKKSISSLPHGISIITFGSARKYTIETGVATAAKDGGFISGDSYTMMEIGNGKYTVAISDGMGNGVRANEESTETLKLLNQILQTGISEQVAIQSINSILALRTSDEVFATLDLMIINLQSANARFLKISSTPSFIKRGKEVIQIEANNLPIGMIEYVDIDTVTKKLMQEDIVIMMSDGVFDSSKQIRNNEIWMRRKIKQLKTTNPQAIADLLLEEVIREEQGDIHDDMTIVVTKVKKHMPQWSSIPLYSSNTN